MGESDRQARIDSMRAMYEAAKGVVDPRSVWLMALGRVVNAYGELQSAVVTLIWELLDPDHTLGQIVASDLQDQARTNLLCSLIRFRLEAGDAVRLEPEIEAVRISLDQAREARNGIVHAHYVFEEGVDWQVPPRVRLAARSRGKQPALRTVPFDLDALIEVIVTIGYTHRSLTALMHACFPGATFNTDEIDVYVPPTKKP